MLFYALVLTLLRFALCVNGTALPRQPMSIADSKGLAKRGYPANSITAYIDGSDYDCTGSDHYTFDNPGVEGCYSVAHRSISSLKVTDFSEEIWIIGWSDNSCENLAAAWAAAVGQDVCISDDNRWSIGSFSLAYAE
jgi:hypothetical protein